MIEAWNSDIQDDCTLVSARVDGKERTFRKPTLPPGSPWVELPGLSLVAEPLASELHSIWERDWVLTMSARKTISQERTV